MNAARKYIGLPVRRHEDPRLLRGNGRYLADVKLAGAAAVAFLRSPHACAQILSIDREKAVSMEGVFAVILAGDLDAKLNEAPMWGLPPDVVAPHTDYLSYQHAPEPPLARTEVKYVGQPIAAVIAADRYTAEDAIERIAVRYDVRRATTDPLEALGPNSARVHDFWSDNQAVRIVVSKGNPAAAFRDAPLVIRGNYRSGRVICLPLEPRGVLAEQDDRSGLLTLWSSTQFPFELRRHLAYALALPESRIRVLAPDVGGGFGAKAVVYPEEVLIAYLAIHLGHPLKWCSDRAEDMVSSIQSRDQQHSIELALSDDGTILGLRDHFVVDCGAYNPTGIVTPYVGIAHIQGPYRVPSMEIEARVAVTNKVPCAPYRGAGRPEVIFAMERILDRAARQLGMESSELRRRNLITPDELPYATGIYYHGKMEYDSGDYPALLEQALAAIGGLDNFRRRQQQARASGRHIGIGTGLFIEGTGRGPYEGATVAVDEDGMVTVATGAASQGQGHETTFAQVCAQELGVALSHVRVVGGDTAATPYGLGTFASRSMVCSGNAIALACCEIRKKAVQAAARFLEARLEDLEWQSGLLMLKGIPGQSLDWAKLASLLGPAEPLGRELGPGLTASALFYPQALTYSSACHVAVVEVDPMSGEVRIIEYVSVDDCGRVVNPLIVRGQTVGGIVQGLGAALLEEALYDKASGQILTGTLLDYLVPTADIVPPCTTRHLETWTGTNELGIKGAGEGGAMAPTAAVANAVDDALSPWNVHICRCPISPETTCVPLLRMA